MECYIAKEFFPKFELLVNEAKNNIFSSNTSELLAIFQLFLALPIKTNSPLVENDVQIRALYNDKNDTSFTKQIFHNAIKNGKLKFDNLEYLERTVSNFSAYYFLNNSNAEMISEENGLVFKGNKFQCESFYDDATITNALISNSWEPVKAGIPPVNSLLIIDSYIFGAPFERKLNSLIEFIKLYKGSLKIPFHLTILFSYESRGNSQCTPIHVNKAFDLLSSLPNMEIQFYLDNNIPRHDRFIFTNYTSGNIGLPFADRDTAFSQNFLGRENKSDKISANYNQYKKDLLFWYGFLKKIPAKMINTQTIYQTKKFTNRIFDPYLEQ